MNGKRRIIGFIQGRFSPLVDGKIQAFPWGDWTEEFSVANENDFYIIELLEYLNHPTEIVKTPFYNVGNCHLAFTVHSADEMYKKLLDKGIEVISRPLLSSEKTAIVFFCCDPNGMRIELVEIV